MSDINKLLDAMLQAVADALGEALLRQVAFVGGCTTALMLTDKVSREQVRYTDDVDLIIHVLGHAGWYAMSEILRSKGFHESPLDNVNCRMRLKRAGQEDLIVDFMPDDARILGFTNRWYADALKTAADMPLHSGTVIRVILPAYFIATKLEAYHGRGNNDPLASRDMEDILNVVNGRESLVEDIAAADPVLRAYIATQFTALLRHPDFDYAVQAAAGNSKGRDAIIFQRWETIAHLQPEFNA